MFEVIRMLRLFARTNSFVVYLQVRTRAGGNFEFATVGVTVDVRAPTKGIMTGKCTGRVRVISSVGRRGSSVSRFEGPKPKIGTPRLFGLFIGIRHFALSMWLAEPPRDWLKLYRTCEWLKTRTYTYGRLFKHAITNE